MCFQGWAAEPGEADRKLFLEIKAKAETGEAHDQLVLGNCYASGKGVTADMVEAAKWYRKAAEQGHVEAQFYLAELYAKGSGVTQDDSEAAKRYRIAAELGHAAAQRELGFAYDQGKGVPKDYSEKIKWFLKAAEQGDLRAQEQLGFGFLRGEEIRGPVTLWGGFKKDLAESKKWMKKASESYRIAADKGDVWAQDWLGRAYKDGLGVEKDMEESAMWFRRAVAAYRKSAEQGDAFAQWTLAGCYSVGQGVPKDEAEAAKWHRKAAAQNYAAAQFSLGGMYSRGEGVIKDETEAYKWYLLAGAQGYEFSKIMLEALEKQLSANQRADGQRLARDWKSKVGPAGPSGVEESRPEFSGTGFVITDDGYFITNQHVAGEGATVRVVTAVGTFPAKVVKVDKANDLALLKAEGKFMALPVITSRGVRLGATAATVGFPNTVLQGFAPKLAKGEIASLAGAQDDARHFQISAPIQPGNSGGALVDERGNVIGVVVAKLSQRAAVATSGALAENVNYAVKSSYVLSFLESVPEVAAKLKEPSTKPRVFEDVVKSVEQATVLVLVY